MRIIKFPAPCIIAKEPHDMCAIMQRYVFTMPFWREKANIIFAMSLIGKFTEGFGLSQQEVTDDEHEALEKGMRVEGQLAPQVNHYYLQCLNAVYTAEEKPKPESAAAPEKS